MFAFMSSVGGVLGARSETAGLGLHRSLILIQLQQPSGTLEGSSSSGASRRRWRQGAAH